MRYRSELGHPASAANFPAYIAVSLSSLNSVSHYLCSALLDPLSSIYFCGAQRTGRKRLTRAATVSRLSFCPHSDACRNTTSHPLTGLPFHSRARRGKSSLCTSSRERAHDQYLFRTFPLFCRPREMSSCSSAKRTGWEVQVGFICTANSGFIRRLSIIWS